MDIIKNLSEIAKTLIESDAKADQDVCKVTILFPLVEALGYDTTKTGDVLLNPAYTEDGEYKLDYGLRGEDEDAIKTVIKTIDFDAEPGLEFSKIRRALATIGHVEYVVITDCFNYYIYSNADDDSTFFDVVSFNICEITNDQIKLIGILSNPSSNARQDFAIDEEGDMIEDPSSGLGVEKYEKKTTSVSKAEKHTSSKVKKRHETFGWILPVVFISLCTCMIITSVLLALHRRSDSSHWYQVVFQHDSYNLDYYTLSGNVGASTYPDQLFVVKLVMSGSNLPEGVSVNFTLSNKVRNDSFKVSYLTDSTGGINTDVALPSTWIDCNIDVSARIDFDENQTAIAKEQYGTGGSKIVQIGDTDKFLIGESTIYYDHTGIAAYIEEKRQQEAAAQLQSIKDYFKNYTIVKYSNGDMCFYPKGYNTDDWPTNSDATNVNITSSNKAYAKIYYDASTNTAEFYFVIGTLMPSAHFWSAGGSFILSDTVNQYSLSTKSGNFYQHVNSMTSITGWCVFTQTGVGNLLPILRTIYAGEQSTVEFKGLNEKIKISNADKNAVMSILDLHDKYFVSGSINLDPSWFED